MHAILVTLPVVVLLVVLLSCFCLFLDVSIPLSISSIVFLSIYTFILFSGDRDATSKSLSGSDVAYIRAVSLTDFILLHKPPL